MDFHQRDPGKLSALLGRLFARINYERKDQSNNAGMKTDAIHALMDRLGNPHLDYPVVHVAGTKGKGSVTRLSAAILSNAGYRTATYTSPHLHKFNERICVDGCPVDDQMLEAGLSTVFKALDKAKNEPWSGRLTFFDIATATGFVIFSKSNVDIAVVEVGLGGRLDSTNVCQPDVCVITNISFDHTRQLGKTLASIAREKAGIIKPEVPVISGVNDAEPANEIAQVAAKNSSQLSLLGTSFGFENVQADPAGTLFDFFAFKDDGKRRTLPKLTIRMLGRHQIENATLAIAASYQLAKRNKKFEIEPDAVYRALESFYHPGRIEIVSQRPLVVLDVAHNSASTRALIETLEGQVPQWAAATKKHAILAISRDKDKADILAQFVKKFDRIVLTQFCSNPRATSANELLEIASNLKTELGCSTELVACPSPTAAWSQVQRGLGESDACAVAGSLFLISELSQVIHEDLCRGASG